MSNTLDINDYQNLTRATRAEPAVSYESVFPNLKSVLQQCMDAVYSGHGMDAVKRALFYKDQSLEPRLKKAMAEMEDMYKAIAAFPEDAVIPTDKIDLLHAILGLQSESGELMNELINSILEDRPVNTLNIREELGDTMWYTSLGIDSIQSTFGETGYYNIEKLKVRYPNKFNTFDAVNRNLEQEQTALSSNA